MLRESLSALIYSQRDNINANNIHEKITQF